MVSPNLSFRLARVLLALIAFLAPATTWAQAKTAIIDQIANLSGQPIVGNQLTIVLSQTMATADGFTILQGTQYVVKVPVNGSFTVSLPPNVGSVPAGTSYEVSYSTPVNRFKETWIVPQSLSPVNLLVVRALTPPTLSVNIPFPQNVPPPNCGDHMVPVWGVPPGQWACGNSSAGAVSLDLENPTAADSGKFQWKPKNSLTLTRISCSVDRGSASVNLDVRQESTPNTNGTQVLAAPLTCTDTTGATTAIANPNVSGLSPVSLVVLTASGGVSVVRVHAEYKLNP